MKIDKVNLKGLVEPFLLERLSFKEFEVFSMPANQLLKNTRFDLAFKLAYLSLINKNEQFAQELYKDHIRAFSLGKYYEPGNDEKYGIDSFYQDFKLTFEDINQNGFNSDKSLIPVSKCGTIINGSHRVACSIFLNKEVKCVRLDELNEPNYNYKFFYERNVSQKLLDYVANVFVEFSAHVFVAFIWPIAKGKDLELKKIIPSIVYEKSVKLNSLGAHNLLSQIYFGEPWLGSIENNFAGVKGKLVECFKDFDPVRVIAFQSSSLDNVLKIKEKIRNLFNVGKHSVHITDTHDEAVRVARVLFNDNGVHFLNNAKPNKFLSLQSNISKFISSLSKQNISHADAVLDGGIVLSAYGLRESSDIDYFCDTELDFHDTELDFHDAELDFHDISKKDLIYDPRLYFYYDDIKFVSFAQTYKMKRNRADVNGDAKDINDYKMMEGVLESNLVKENISKAKQVLYYKKIKLKKNIISLLKRLGLYNLIRTIYRGIRNVVKS